MKYYPIYLDIQNRNCLVVGGGAVGTRKVMALLSCGALVMVVSPAASSTLEALSRNGKITLEKRPFQASDLKGKFLVIGATNDTTLNRQIHKGAERLGILYNIADRPEACNFILPSIVNRGDLVIAISTSGTSPAFAKKLRKDLEKEFGKEYAEFLKLMGAIRRRLLANNNKPEVNKQLFEQLINSTLVQMIRDRNYKEINQLLFATLGEGYRFDQLMKP